ncbi:hypothetical protein [Dyadobacter jiangsuensis]|uniref:Uncharacterized protein n=1 Tax=Dyadobacter jiangsuensis TaxID=1591085 RepID=A0A2P8FCU8_9BACT|nr:hypothetical protein [Dyadobacter jiangsuensis]PSL19518.1 hypothetical protein CLV60_12636 [Dyadobacter jiangsuensis]
MNPTVYNAALVIHIVGITVMAGTTFLDFFTFRVFRAAFLANDGRQLAMAGYLHSLQRFLGIGMLVILASGVAMMVELHQVWGVQLWFRVKMAVLLLIIINGLGFRRAIGKSLSQALSDGSLTTHWRATNRNFMLVQLIQMLFFLIIYVLSIFKFN